MALAGIFAACTNDEFLENGTPQGPEAGQERPTISNVTLNIGEADTRFAYEGGKFAFEKGDVISALLMDENNTGVRFGITTNTDEWNKLTWLEKYHLVDYVHTNFPFEYDGSKFASGCNMLEGNYFLTYPYVCLDGNRQGRIDIAKQEQVGDEAADRARTVADNQYFIGYAQLKAGEGVSDFKAELVPILAPVRIALTSETNLGTTLHVTKLVLSHPKLTGTLMIDPTRAKYADPAVAPNAGGWNLSQEYVWNHTDATQTSNEGDIYHFNYANFLANQPATTVDAEWEKELYYNARYGSEVATDYVYNVEGEVGASSDIRLDRKPNTYYWDDAIRATVQPMREFNNPEYATQYVEVYLKDTEDADCMVLAPNSTIEAVMMLPAFQGDESPLMLSIYTKEGIIKDIDLSKQHTGAGTDVKTSGILDRFDPTDKQIQRVEVTLDNPAVVQYPTNVTINNEDDLLQWVNWLNEDPQNTGNKNPIATFTNDITINDDLAAAIEQLDENYILSIVADAAPGNNLRIATSEAHANILERLDVASNVTVEVMDGAVLNMTENSYNVAHKITSVTGYPENTWGRLHIEVAAEGTLNIVSNDKTVIQGGFDNAGRPVADRVEVMIENKGTIEVKNTQLLGFYIVNEGKMNVGENASIYFAPYGLSPSLNTIRGTINVEAAKTEGATNGEIGGTINNNFYNEGTINNGGRILNIVNLGNSDDLKPGTINVMNINAYTDLTKNTGKVNYGQYLTGVNFNNTDQGYVAGGTYVYEGSAGESVTVGSLAQAGAAGLQLSDLNKAYVTDATITSGDLVVDIESITTLKNLAVENAGIVDDNKTRVLKFATETAPDMEGQERPQGLGTVVFRGKSHVDNVSFQNLAEADGMIKNAVIDNGADVTFDANGTVAFWEGACLRYGGLYFEAARLTVESGCALHADNLIAIDGTKSEVYNFGTINLTTGTTADTNVTVHQNTPNR